jgi:hypothetical protein
MPMGWCCDLRLGNRHRSELNDREGALSATSNMQMRALGITHDARATKQIIPDCHMAANATVHRGDMECAGWKALLQRADFRSALNNVDIFVASHHGREDGYCEEMFQYFGTSSPRFVVVSDKSIVHETQKTGAWYAGKATGGVFNGEANRRFITTRSDGSLIVVPNALNNTYTFAKRA